MSTQETSSFEQHPGLRGREPEARALADALRRLIRLSVSTAPPPEETAAMTQQLSAVADRLEAHTPAVPLPRFIPPGSERAPGQPLLGGAMPYDPVVGPFNPLAPPMTLAFGEDRALGHVTFDVAYEGAPGCVHGAALAGTFDIILTAANAIVGATGPTVRLNLHFRRPTLIGEEAVFEGWVTEVTERRVHSLGRLVQGGVVTVEAVGEFAILTQEDLERMATGRRRAFDGPPPEGA